MNGLKYNRSRQRNMRTVIPKNAVLIPPEANCVFKGILFDVYQWQQEQFDGRKKTFEMLRRADTVKVIAIKDDKLVVLDQQQPNHPIYYDIPGGMHDNPSETELQAVQRELLEEAGMTFNSWRLVVARQPMNKIEQFVYIFVATDFVSQVAPAYDSGEKISIKLVSFDEAIALANSLKNRHLPRDILVNAGSIEGLKALPEVT